MNECGLRLKGCFRAKDHDALAGELTAIAVRQRQFGAVNLSVAALPHELLRRLDDREKAVHPRMHAGKPAAIGIHREAPAWCDRAAGDERRAFAFLQKPRSSKNKIVLMVKAS